MKKTVLLLSAILLLVFITGCALEQQELTTEISDVNGRLLIITYRRNKDRKAMLRAQGVKR